MMRSLCLSALAITLVLLADPCPAMAADPLPGALDPGRLEQRFERPPEPRSVREAIIPETKAPLPPEEAGQIRFQLTAIEIEGATVFKADDFRPLYEEFLGREISLLDIYQVAAKATARYGNAGYVLSRVVVPAQTVSNGTVRLRAVEGYIDRVIVEGKPYARPEFFAHFSEMIKASRPLHNSVLERYLLLANGLPGVKVQSVMRPSADSSGAASLVLSIAQRGYDGAISLDNRGTKAVGRWQGLVEGSANNLLGGADRSTIRLAFTPEDTEELRYLAFSHQRVLRAEGTSLELSLTRSDSEPGGEQMRLLDVETKSRSTGLSLSHPVIRERSTNLSLSGGYTWRESETIQLGEKTAEDILHIAQLGFSFDNADPTGVNLVNLTLHQGLDIGNAEVGSRSGAEEDFTRIELHLSRTQRLNEDWSATLRVGGQLAFSGLPVSEQFGIGGETFGRAYDPSEWTGDHGLAASAEVGRRLALGEKVEGNPYIFYDIATVWRKHPVNEGKSDSADSAGVGIRLAFPKNISLALEAAKPLDARQNPEDDRVWRYSMRVMARF